MSNKHVYEIEPRSVGRMIFSNQSKVASGEFNAELDAGEYLAEHPDETAVGIYHSYPSPGPVRRFVKEVRRS